MTDNHALAAVSPPERRFPLKELGYIVAGLLMVIFVGLIYIALQPPSDEWKLAYDRDMCASRAGIRKDTSLMYQTTKELYYGAYVQCIVDLGHRTIPPLP